MYSIRKAKSEDCSAILRLIQELAVFEREPEAVVVSVEELQQDGFGDNPVWFAWVAEINNQIVGLAICYIRYSTWRGKTLYLEDLIVNEYHRGKGIGKGLLDTVIEHARVNNYRQAMWQVLDWNTPAVDFYEKYGASIEKGWWNVVFTTSTI